MRFMQWDAKVVQHTKINVMHHINRMKNIKSHDDLSRCKKKKFDKIKHSFMLKAPNNLE